MMSVNTFLPPSPVVPGMLLISAITNANPMVVTIVNSLYNTYVLGQLVCLTIPLQYGMFQANELTGEIIEINSINFTLNIDASNFDAFIVPSPSLPPPSRPSSLAPAGSRNIYNITVEPFHSLNGNQGN